MQIISNAEDNKRNMFKKAQNSSWLNEERRKFYKTNFPLSSTNKWHGVKDREKKGSYSQRGLRIMTNEMCGPCLDPA